MNRLSSVWQVARGRVLFHINGTDSINPDSAMKVSGFYRGVIYISSQISKLPFSVKDKNNTVLLNDRVTKLIGQAPNPEINSMDFWLLALQTAIIEGDHYSEIERDTVGRPVNLWPLEPGRVNPDRDVNGNLYYRVTNFSKPDSFLAPQNVFHLKNFHLTKDGIKGLGLVSYATSTLGISIGADKMANALFRNAGLPSGVLEIPGTLSDDAYKRLKENWQDNQNGENSGKVAMLEEGMKYNVVSHAPDVMQFLESRKFSVLEIARFLGLHPTKLFDIEGAKFANMENANLETVTDLLDTWARRIEKEINVKLLSYSFDGRKADIDTFELTRGDMATRGEYFSKRMQSGSITPNQIREMEGEAPYKGGDRYYIAANNLSPADRIDEIVDAQVKDKSPPKESTGSIQTESVQNLVQELLKVLK
jgi:HK97 family phage portal protein